MLLLCKPLAVFNNTVQSNKKNSFVCCFSKSSGHSWLQSQLQYKHQGPQQCYYTVRGVQNTMSRSSSASIPTLSILACSHESSAKLDLHLDLISLLTQKLLWVLLQSHFMAVNKVHYCTAFNMLLMYLIFKEKKKKRRGKVWPSYFHQSNKINALKRNFC